MTLGHGLTGWRRSPRPPAARVETSVFLELTSLDFVCFGIVGHYARYNLAGFSTLQRPKVEGSRRGARSPHDHATRSVGRRLTGRPRAAVPTRSVGGFTSL